MNESRDRFARNVRNKRPANISRKGNIKEPEPEDTRTPVEKLKDQVTPFWR